MNHENLIKDLILPSLNVTPKQLDEFRPSCFREFEILLSLVNDVFELGYHFLLDKSFVVKVDYFKHGGTYYTMVLYNLLFYYLNYKNNIIKKIKEVWIEAHTRAKASEITTKDVWPLLQKYQKINNKNLKSLQKDLNDLVLSEDKFRKIHSMYSSYRGKKPFKSCNP